MKEIIAQVAEIYSKMSLLELLEEENLLEKIHFERRPDPAQQILWQQLLNEIERKLR